MSLNSWYRVGDSPDFLPLDKHPESCVGLDAAQDPTKIENAHREKYKGCNADQVHSLDDEYIWESFEIISQREYRIPVLAGITIASSVSHTSK